MIFDRFVDSSEFVAPRGSDYLDVNDLLEAKEVNYFFIVLFIFMWVLLVTVVMTKFGHFVN